MSHYLSKETIKEAVDRLNISASQTSLADYLIFKRALMNAQRNALENNERIPDFVITGLRSEPFIQAIDEFSLWPPRDGIVIEQVDNPYYIPFGSKRDATLGYRTKKFPSNGSSDTVGRWQSRGSRPIELLPGTSPKAYRFSETSGEELEDFFSVRNANNDFSGKKPGLLDTAIWWFRFTDLQNRFSSSPTVNDVVNGFIDDFGLTQVEITALFDTDQSSLVNISIDQSDPHNNVPINFILCEEVANPSEYLPPAPAGRTRTTGRLVSTPSQILSPFSNEDFQQKVENVISYISGKGFVFQPWQIAAFISAVRTKPFVILGGISGTGKTKISKLVSEATCSRFHSIPVRPNWSDSSELLGFTRIDNTFQPGSLLQVAKKAQEEPERQYFYLLDEMNIARVEYYFAEVLSLLETKETSTNGYLWSEPLVQEGLGSDSEWSNVRLPENLCIVGSVNMDETTYGFSKKVLDRAFVIEFSSIDLSIIGELNQQLTNTSAWARSDWRPVAYSLPNHPRRGDQVVEQIIGTLQYVNDILRLSQLQFGYRVRDEIVLFCLAAEQCSESFTTTNSGAVDPLDLAIAMKILPRIQGGGASIHKVLEGLDAWANPRINRPSDDPGTGRNIGFAFCAERIAIMRNRLKESGFTSYWL